MNNEALKNRIAKLETARLIELRAKFDQIVDIPKNHPLEFKVLVALNGECDNRGICYNDAYENI